MYYLRALTSEQSSHTVTEVNQLQNFMTSDDGHTRADQIHATTPFSPAPINLHGPIPLCSFDHDYLSKLPTRVVRTSFD
jgi:hypothetical protein